MWQKNTFFSNEENGTTECSKYGYIEVTSWMPLCKLLNNYKLNILSYL